MAKLNVLIQQENSSQALSKQPKQPLGLNLAERIYRLQVIKQLIRERHMAHSADEYNESKLRNDSFWKLSIVLTHS